MEQKNVYNENSSGKTVGCDLSDFLGDAIQYAERRYGCAPKDGVEDRIQRVAWTVARLMATLNFKGILSDEEVFNIADIEDLVQSKGIYLESPRNPASG